MSLCTTYFGSNKIYEGLFCVEMIKPWAQKDEWSQTLALSVSVVQFLELYGRRIPKSRERFH